MNKHEELMSHRVSDFEQNNRFVLKYMLQPRHIYARSQQLTPSQIEVTYLATSESLLHNQRSFFGQGYRHEL